MALRKQSLKSKVEFATKRARALVLATSRLKYFNEFYKFKYNKVVIKNQSTVWGSCSKNGNLNFNFRIITLAPELSDYIIVHELCHLGELNHSKKFWALVAKCVPNYKEIHTKLRRYTLNEF